MVGIAIARRRWVARGRRPEDVEAVALWAIPAGLVGARAYHVATDWARFEGRWWHIPAVWEGGLGIPGGLLAGVAAGAWVAHRRGLPVAALLDVAAPAIPVAQAIGRLGNWFNQELFGRPTDLPWGLEIDRAHRPTGYLDVTTFHPDVPLRSALEPWRSPGCSSLSSVVNDCAGRDSCSPSTWPATPRAWLWVEALRIDPASELLGLRVNLWTSGIALVAALGVIVVQARRSRNAPDDKRVPVA